MNCPMCGQKVTVSQSSEGTGCYIPAEFEEAKRRVLEIVKIETYSDDFGNYLIDSNTLIEKISELKPEGK